MGYCGSSSKKAGKNNDKKIKLSEVESVRRTTDKELMDKYGKAIGNFTKWNKKFGNRFLVVHPSKTLELQSGTAGECDRLVYMLNQLVRQEKETDEELQALQRKNEVELTFSEEGPLGITFAGAGEVLKLHDGQAVNSGMRVHDMITSVGDVRTEGLEHDFVVGLLGNSARPLKITVLHNPRSEAVAAYLADAKLAAEPEVAATSEADADTDASADVVAEVEVTVEAQAQAAKDFGVQHSTEIGSEHQGIGYNAAHYDGNDEEAEMLAALNNRDAMRHGLGLESTANDAEVVSPLSPAPADSPASAEATEAEETAVDTAVETTEDVAISKSMKKRLKKKAYLAKKKAKAKVAEEVAEAAAVVEAAAEAARALKAAADQSHKQCCQNDECKKVIGAKGQHKDSMSWCKECRQGHFEFGKK